MFPLNTILAWNINIITNKKYDNNNIIIASRAYFFQRRQALAHEGQSWEGMWEMKNVGNELPIAGSCNSSPGAP
jgi:hypothetical protein